MDQTWNYEDWKPSVALVRDNELPTSEKSWQFKDIDRSRKTVEDLRDALIKWTKKIEGECYNAPSWRIRAHILNQLGFPELGISDAIKTLKLCKMIIKPGSLSIQDVRQVAQARKHIGKDDAAELAYEATLLVLEGLFCLQAFGDSIAFYNNLQMEWGKDLPFDPFQRITLGAVMNYMVACHEDDKIGGTLTLHKYPWLTLQEPARHSNFIATMNKRFQEVSDCLEVRRSSTLGGHDSYGVYAKRDIEKGEKILIDRHHFCFSPEQGLSLCYNCLEPLRRRACDCCVGNIHTDVTLHCCGMKFCSSNCSAQAVKYHQSLCGKDLSQIINAVQTRFGGTRKLGPARRRNATWNGAESKDYPEDAPESPDFVKLYPLVYARILAMSLKFCKSPLWLFNVAGLSEPSDPVEVKWSLYELLIDPLYVTEVISGDIFKALNFDPWVLYTIRCNPNVNAEVVDGHDDEWLSKYDSPIFRTVMTNSRFIKKGDEVCVSYIDQRLLEGPKGVRLEHLRPWVGAECRCERCSLE